MSDTPKLKNEAQPKPQIVCPPGLCFTFSNPARRFLQNPYKILQPYIKPGMTILDVGPGMGYFTIPLAALSGDTGKVIAADLQQAMLEGIRRNAEKAGLTSRITLLHTKTDEIGITEAIDFCLAFWMVHEVPDRKRFLGEIFTQLKPGGLFLLSEPKIHVSKKSFSATVEIAKWLGFHAAGTPKIFLSRTVLLKK
jgi:ubiquinone/menaquinone biosynthesis C-methylase UbiE